MISISGLRIDVGEFIVHGKSFFQERTMSMYLEGRGWFTFEFRAT